MSSTNPRVDAYIAKSADFARPILEHLRKVVRQAAPDIEETIKWGVPYFQRNGMVCGMAAFKQHCAFVFWNGKLVFDGNDAPGKGATQAMGQFGRITRLADLPPRKVIIGYVKKAVALDEAGVKRAVKPRSGRPGKVSVPADLATALKGNAKARNTFDAFSPTNKCEYVEWITEAKRAQTRQKRLATAIAWMAEGKPRNWKYQSC